VKEWLLNNETSLTKRILQSLKIEVWWGRPCSELIDKQTKQEAQDQLNDGCKP
jgi:hypothetical protein